MRQELGGTALVNVVIHPNLVKGSQEAPKGITWATGYGQLRIQRHALSIAHNILRLSHFDHIDSETFFLFQ